MQVGRIGVRICVIIAHLWVINVVCVLHNSAFLPTFAAVTGYLYPISTLDTLQIKKSQDYAQEIPPRLRPCIRCDLSLRTTTMDDRRSKPRYGRRVHSRQKRKIRRELLLFAILSLERLHPLLGSAFSERKLYHYFRQHRQDRRAEHEHRRGRDHRTVSA